MTLHIDDQEAIALAQEISSLTGESPAAALVEALRRRRDELARERDDAVARSLQRAVDIGRRTAAYDAPRHVDVEAFFLRERAAHASD